MPQLILWSLPGCSDQACPQAPCWGGSGAFSQAASGWSDSRTSCYRALGSSSALWGGGSLHSPSLFSLRPKIVQPEISTRARQEKGPSPLQHCHQPRLDGSFLNSRLTENSHSELLGFCPSGGWVSPVSTNYPLIPKQELSNPVSPKIRRSRKINHSMILGSKI